MDLIVTGKGEARWGEHLWRCALGPVGVAAEKREGDGATPAGRFAFRRLLYRPDRLAPPPTGLALLPLAPGMAGAMSPAIRSTTGPSPCPIRRAMRSCGVATTSTI